MSVLDDLPSATDRWAAFVDDLGAADMWTAGCVFPTEMAFLFAYCEILGLKEFVESGRQEGLSTFLFGHFAKKTGTKIYSIDFEDSPQVAEACRKRVQGLPVELLVGDAFQVMGQVVGKLTGPAGIFVDGPKNWSSMALLGAAAANPHVKLLSSHNTRRGGNLQKFMQASSGVPVSYLDILPKGLPAFEKLRSHELERLQKLDVKGDARTTLSVSLLTPQTRGKAANSLNVNFRLYPPVVVRWAWRTNNSKVLAGLFHLSYRLFGPEYAPDEQIEGAV